MAKHSTLKKDHRIKAELREQMNSQFIDISVIRRLLQVLEVGSCPFWCFRFFSSYWDYLLQREIIRLDLSVKPSWLANTRVSLFNGTVEELKDNSDRSPFLLEEDPAEQRCFTEEANITNYEILWDRMFVVVGMSFECATDKFLLNALGRAEDHMPIGESIWLVVNRNSKTLESSCSRIARALPRASVKPVCMDLNVWLSDGLTELHEFGVLAFNSSLR